MPGVRKEGTPAGMVPAIGPNFSAAFRLCLRGAAAGWHQPLEGSAV
jgi:hypothetical protein